MSLGRDGLNSNDLEGSTTAHVLLIRQDLYAASKRCVKLWKRNLILEMRTTSWARHYSSSGPSRGG